MLQALLFNDTSYEDHHGCQLVIRQIHRLATEAGISIVQTSPIGHDWEADAYLLDSLNKVDLCIVNGEGTMHDVAPAAMKLVALARYCKLLGVPCVLINSVWQRNPQLIEHARDFQAIFVRDGLSQAELLAYGIEARLVPDLTLTYQPAVGEFSRHGFIVNGSVIRPVQQQMWTLLAEPAASSAQYLSIRTIPPLRIGGGHGRFFFSSLKANIKMWRHWLSSRFTRPAAAVSSKGLSRLRWRYCELSTDGFLRRLSRAQGVVTGRFHMVTLCMVCRTPFMALPSNTHKIEALLAEAGMPERLCSSYAEGLGKLASMSFSDAELARLDAFLEGARLSAQQMFADIAGLGYAPRKA